MRSGTENVRASGYDRSSGHPLDPLDWPVQFVGDGGGPVGHNVLVAHSRHGRGVAQAVHDLACR
jgi:hypothetical protein